MDVPLPSTKPGKNKQYDDNTKQAMARIECLFPSILLVATMAAPSPQIALTGRKEKAAIVVSRKTNSFLLHVKVFSCCLLPGSEGLLPTGEHFSNSLDFSTFDKFGAISLAEIWHVTKIFSCQLGKWQSQGTVFEIFAPLSCSLWFFLFGPWTLSHFVR